MGRIVAGHDEGPVKDPSAGGRESPVQVQGHARRERCVARDRVDFEDLLGVVHKAHAGDLEGVGAVILHEDFEASGGAGGLGAQLDAAERAALLADKHQTRLPPNAVARLKNGPQVSRIVGVGDQEAVKPHRPGRVHRGRDLKRLV